MKSIQLHCRRSLHGAVVVLAVGQVCGAPSRAERAVLATDAEVFETVVRNEISPDPADSVASLRVMRVDSRPVTDNGDLAPNSARPTGFDLEQPVDSLSQASVARIAEQRKAILGDLRVEEGGPFTYPDCPGARSRRSGDSARASPDACPVTWRRYITVGIPYRGAAAAIVDKLRKLAPLPDSSAEVWTVLVGENSVGPSGQNWGQYAWLLRRDPQDGRLALVEKVLLSWAE